MLGISNLLFSLILSIVLISLNALKNYSNFEKFKLNVGKVNSGEYYRLLSSGFLHGDIQHLLFNCFTLFIFGDTVITSLGEINFVLLYFSCLIFSGWLSMYFNKNNSFYSAVGASGAVIGVVYSSILLYPGMKLAFLFFPIPMPAYLFAIGNAYGIYTPLTNKYFEKKMTMSREKYGSFLLSRYKTFDFIESMKSSNNYGLLGFIGDQSPKKDSKSYVRAFMGTKVPVFTGAERIAKNYNFPIFYCQINRVKRGFYEAEISVLAMNPLEYKDNEITDLFFNKLERQIVQNPSEYLWTHNRFKHMVH